MAYQTTPCFVHHTALVGDPPEHRDHWGREGVRPSLAAGCDIGAYVSVDAGIHRSTTIGARTRLMKHCHIGHDSLIGEDCELAPGVMVAGEVVIGDKVKVGIGACFRPFVVVGDGARIGAGSVVVKDVPAGEVWAGNPARKLEQKVGQAPARFWADQEPPGPHDLDFQREVA